MIVEVLRDNMRLIVRAYSKATGQTEAAISRELYGSSGFLRGFYAGKKTISLNKYEEMLQAMFAKWPQAAERPKLRPALPRIPRRGKSPRENRISA